MVVRLAWWPQAGHLVSPFTPHAVPGVVQDYTMFSGQHNDKKDIIREARRKAEAKEPPRTFLGAFILAENIHKHITDLTSLK